MITTSDFITPELTLPRNVRIYAIGDIHGHANLLHGLLELVKRDLCKHPLQKGHEMSFVFLGDYVDRGSDSKGVLDILVDLKRENGRHVFLAGNHDRDFLDVLRYLKGNQSITESSATLTVLGSPQTYASYGVPVRYRTDWEIAEMEALTRLVPRDHQDFLSSLQTSARTDKYLFIHDPCDAFQGERQQTYPRHDAISRYLLSRRGERSEPSAPVIVHGHLNLVDLPSPQSLPHRIGLNYDDRNTDHPMLKCAILEAGHRRRFLSFPSPV